MICAASSDQPSVPPSGGLPEGENLKILQRREDLVDEGSPIPSSSPAAEMVEGARRARPAGSTRSPSPTTRARRSSSPTARPLPYSGASATGVNPGRRAEADAPAAYYFGTMMVEEGDADGLISGLTQVLPRPPSGRPSSHRHPPRGEAGLRRLHPDPGTTASSSCRHHVNIDPTPAELAEIALLTVEFARRFGVRAAGRHALLLELRFGNTHPRRSRCAARPRSCAEKGPRPGDRRARLHGRHRASSRRS